MSSLHPDDHHYHHLHLQQQRDSVSSCGGAGKKARRRLQDSGSSMATDDAASDDDDDSISRLSLLGEEEGDKTFDPDSADAQLGGGDGVAGRRSRRPYPRRELDWVAVAALVILTYFAAATRYRGLEEPDHVCWDETHFGKHASWYIKNEFFFDVHPPLGKMLIAFVGELSGYNGSFAYEKPGDKYTDVSQYKGMRIFAATLGVLLIPFCFGIVWRLTGSLSASILGASFILADNGFLVLTQYILLDPPLLFAIVASTFFYLQFRSYSHAPFCWRWWAHLSFCGASLAAAASTKFVGLFVVLLVGVCTAKELWDLLGDWTLSIFYVIKHLIARVLCLIVLPFSVYALFFYVHLELLYRSGSGDGFYSSAFQSQLQGNSLHKAEMPADVAYGATVTLKNHRTGGAYLHSHHHVYPEEVGPQQQQVTTYSHKDENNVWLIKKFEGEPSADQEAPIELVKSGDWIRLEHVPTKRNLHSHRDPAPITKKQFQVTCYGNQGVGDINDIWKIEITNGEPGEAVKAVKSKFRLIHVQKGCALQSHNKKLPKWGWEQLEVTCNPKINDFSHAQWNFEDNVYPRLPNVSFDFYRPTFLERFVESHMVMLQGNSGLKPKEGEVASRPWHWPINLKGQVFSGREHFIYLLGNPIVFWSVLLALVVFGVISLVIHGHRQRSSSTTKANGVDGTSGTDLAIRTYNDTFLESAAFLLLGYALHYLPFYLMGRILYFHHYFPALLFGCMFTGVVTDYSLRFVVRLLPSRLESICFHGCLGLILAGLGYSFFLFSPLAYGVKNVLSDDPNSVLHGLKWLDSWEF